ncbi:hypothetical protein TNCV_512861 [Trichonephila clavipes]|nr:hypothetical protein TNCV_512861 [Trichonephila clavipes]
MAEVTVVKILLHTTSMILNSGSPRANELLHSEYRKKPSELLRRLNRRAASHNIPKELLLELFLQQLPTSVQTILASIPPITVEKAAEFADRILEVSTPNVSLSTNAIASYSENRILQEIERLNKRIDDLTMRQRTPERRNNSRPRNRSFSRFRESCCWYHKRFHERAKQCIPPCSYKKRIQRGVIATTFSQPHISRRLYIKDKSSNPAFLIYTGSDVSVLPASISKKGKATVFSNYQPLIHLLSTFMTFGPPVFAKPRRLAPDRLKIAKSEFQHMLNLGHIRPSKNLVKAYHQIPINEEDIHKTAILTPFGLYESTRMQFSLCNAASTFQRFVVEVLRGLNFVYAFIDDILVTSSSAAEYIQHLRLLFQRLDQYGLSINPSKCTFGVPTFNFLRFQVCSSGIKPLEDRVEAILKFSKPTTITQLRIRNKKRPKRNVKIKPDEVLEWTDEATTAFELVKQALSHATLLYHPMPNAPLGIFEDALDFAVCGALAQYHENVSQTLAFLSIKLSVYQCFSKSQLVDEELKQLLQSNSTSLNLKQQYVPLEDITLACDVSTNHSGPFILKDYRKIVFQHLHGLLHPGIGASTKLVTQRFVWPNIRHDIKAWVNSCHPC